MKKNLYVLILILVVTAVVYYGVNNNFNKSNDYEENHSTNGTAINQNSEDSNWPRAEEDINYQSQSDLPPFYSLTIPQNVSYYQDGEPLYLKTQTGLNITICSTCQLFISGCGGLIDGNPEEGGCAVNEVNLGSNIIVAEYYQPANPQVIFGYYKNLKNSSGEVVSVKITTDDNRALTEQDKKMVEKIMGSIE